MAFKVAGTNPRAGYDFAYEREALDPIGAEIVPVRATDQRAYVEAVGALHLRSRSGRRRAGRADIDVLGHEVLPLLLLGVSLAEGRAKCRRYPLCRLDHRRKS